jgi:type IV pilus assembly protein PilM
VFGFGSKEYLLGLDIGSGSIKALQLKETKGTLKIELFGMKSLPAEMIVDGAIMDGLGVVTAIKELAGEQKLKIKDVALSISGTSVIVKKIALPHMPEEELEKQIKFEAEQYIPFDINDVYLDFHILAQEEQRGEGQTDMEVLLVATKKDKLNDYANAVREAGLTPKVVDVDAFAIENMYCANYDVIPAELTALVNIGASVMNINVLKGGVSVFTRDITIGGNRYSERIQQDLGLSLDDAEAAKKGRYPGVNEAALNEAIAAVDMEVATEIGRSFDYFRTTSPEADIARIVVCGGCSKTKSLPARISEQVGIETSVANPFAKLDATGLKMSPEELAEVAPDAAVVVGLALRREGDR